MQSLQVYLSVCFCHHLMATRSSRPFPFRVHSNTTQKLPTHSTNTATTDATIQWSHVSSTHIVDCTCDTIIVRQRVMSPYLVHISFRSCIGVATRDTPQRGRRELQEPGDTAYAAHQQVFEQLSTRSAVSPCRHIDAHRLRHDTTNSYNWV